ncbi:MAG TPA: hypothetical protein VFU60_02315 [Ktedonobacterales bacterium]|nr:hypothetical protein [Ktedonobacterales bacterium]
MPRQYRWVAAGIYQPTYEPRHAYGPRRMRQELIEDFLQTSACDLLDAKTVARYGGALGAICEQVAVPMPRGGVRHLLICPRCQGRTQWLYGVDHPMFRRVVYGCRVCWGLRYQSQYAGRRLEAHPDYLQAKLRRQIAHTPRDVSLQLDASPRRLAAMRTHQRRMRRYTAAQERVSAQTYRYLERRDLALNLALCVLLARGEAEHRREWRKIINRVLWHQNTETMRDLLAKDSTPDWVCQVFVTALKAANQAREAHETTAKQRADVRKAVETALETDEKAQFEALIEAARMEQLRAQYAALSQARKAKRAA